MRTIRTFETNKLKLDLRVLLNKLGGIVDLATNDDVDVISRIVLGDVLDREFFHHV